MEVEAAQHKIETPLAKGQAFFICDKEAGFVVLGRCACHHCRRKIARDHLLYTAPFLDVAGEMARVTAKVKNIGKVTKHVVQAIGKPFCDLAKQEIVAAEIFGGSFPVLLNQPAVKQASCIGHFIWHGKIMAHAPVQAKRKPWRSRRKGGGGERLTNSFVGSQAFF